MTAYFNSRLTSSVSNGCKRNSSFISEYNLTLLGVNCDENADYFQTIRLRTGTLSRRQPTVAVTVNVRSLSSMTEGQRRLNYKSDNFRTALQIRRLYGACTARRTAQEKANFGAVARGDCTIHETDCECKHEPIMTH